MINKNYLPSTQYREQMTSNPHNARLSISPDLQHFWHINPAQLTIKLVSK